MKSYISKILLAISLFFAFGFYANAQRVAKKKRVVVVKKKPVRVVKTKRAKVINVKKTPRKAVIVKHRGVKYRFANNQFYRWNNGNYIVARPAIGLRIKFLPIGYTSVVIKGKRYYRHNNIYYVKQNSAFQVVSIV